MIQNRGLMILGVLIVFQSLQCLDYKQRSDDLCKNVNREALSNDGDKRKEEREEYPIILGLPFDDLSKVVKDKEYGAAIQGNFAILFIFSILLIVFSIFFFCIQICNLCCCKNNHNQSEGKMKYYLYTSIFLIVSFIIFVIVTMIFTFGMIGGMEQISCAVAVIPSDLIEGINKSPFIFIGFNPLLSMFKEFQSEISQLQNVSSNFQNIIDLNLPQQTQDGINKAADYETQFLNNKISSGKATLVVALTNGPNLSTGVEAMKTEFEVYKVAGDSIHEASVEGEKLSNSSEYQQIQTGLAEVVNRVESIKTNVDKFANDMFNILNDTQEYQKLVTIIILILLGFLILLYLTVLIIVICQVKKQKCFGCSCCVRIISLVVGFLIIIFSFATLIIFILSFANGSQCHFYEKMLTQSDLNNIFTALDITVDQDVNNIINTCLAVGSSGNLDSVFNVNSFDEIKKLLDGLTIFSEFKKTFDEMGNTSKSIEEIQKQLENSLNGINPNTEEIPQTIEKLNEEISCANQQIVLNLDQCKPNFDCKTISSMNSFSQPACSSDPNLSVEFTNAKSYSDDNISLMNQMINQLTGNQATSPSSIFASMRNKFSIALTEFTTIESNIKNTIAVASQFVGGFVKIANCSIFRKIFLNVEAAICFKFNYNLFYMALFLFVSSWVALILNMELCCTLRNSKLYLPEKKGFENVKQQENEQLSDEEQFEDRHDPRHYGDANNQRNTNILPFPQQSEDVPLQTNQMILPPAQPNNLMQNNLPMRQDIYERGNNGYL